VFCAVLCTTVVHSDMHTHEKFLKMSVGLGLDLVFVHLFTLGGQKCVIMSTLHHAYTSSWQRQNNVFTLIFDQQLPMVIMCTLCSLHYITKYVISYDTLSRRVL